MLPSPAFSDSRNQRHGYSEPRRQVSANTVILSRCPDSPYVIFGKFRIMTRRSFWDQCGLGSGIMRFATRNRLRPCLRPMARASHEGFRMKPGATSLTPSSAPVQIPISGIFSRRGPIEIFGRVIQNISVAMRAMILVKRLISIEGGANKPVNFACYFPTINTQDMREIASAMGRWQEHSPRAFALPIWLVSPYAADVRDRIIRRLDDAFPNFHPQSMASFAFNVKSLKALIYRGSAA